MVKVNRPAHPSCVSQNGRQLTEIQGEWYIAALCREGAMQSSICWQSLGIKLSTLLFQVQRS
eukprot:1562802-Rhodomonas_salina.1